MKVFCVIPAYNEEKKIALVLEKVKVFVDQIVIVDDGSSDHTFEVSKRSGCKVLRHLINRGQGAALETGDQYSLRKKADIIVHFDADGQFKAQEIEDVLAPLKKGEVDVVLGSRFMGKENEMPFFKKNVIMPIARLVMKLFFKIELSDPQCGFRAMTASACEKIKIEQGGMAHASEILYKIFKNKLRVKEVPISVRYDNFGQGIFGGKGTGSGGVRILIDLFLSKLMD